jgi:hypothetical protein
LFFTFLLSFLALTHFCHERKWIQIVSFLFETFFEFVEKLKDKNVAASFSHFFDSTSLGRNIFQLIQWGVAQ